MRVRRSRETPAITGDGGALAWEFATTDAEATIKARAHFLLFKARFAAQGYRILSPTGSLIAYGPTVLERGTGDTVREKLLFT